ncbi:MAG: type I methionyl aminopeptidase [Actinomycetota bacterium]|nr:type I methionyl aminopeptidase [Actinomycetota bacterium]
MRTADEVDRMRRAGHAAAEILLEAAAHVSPGVTTDYLDEVVHMATVARGGYPSPLNYRGYPKSVCTSVNEVICHGIPDSRPLVAGDIVNVDVTVFLDGVHGDTSITLAVGEIDEHDQRLVIETRAAMNHGIDAAGPGQPINAIGGAIERHARRHNLGVVREFIGHGIGTEFHSAIQIPHYFDPAADTILVPGMTFTVEPMLTLGDPSCFLWDDNWTAVTRDGRRTAQFEHTVLVTEDGVERLTVTPDGLAPADVFALTAPT